LLHEEDAAKLVLRSRLHSFAVVCRIVEMVPKVSVRTVEVIPQTARLLCTLYARD